MVCQIKMRKGCVNILSKAQVARVEAWKVSSMEGKRVNCQNQDFQECHLNLG